MTKQLLLFLHDYAAGAMLAALYAVSHFYSNNPRRFYDEELSSSFLDVITTILQMWKLRQK